jgi:hypothetical protein
MCITPKQANGMQQSSAFMPKWGLGPGLHVLKGPLIQDGEECLNRQFLASYTRLRQKGDVVAR